MNTVFTTKSNDGDYALKRERAQKISFAKIQEILQRNVSKTISKSFTQYDYARLEQYAQSPLNNLDNIREVSRYLTRVSMLYQQMILYFSTMPLYTYNITPTSEITGNFNPEKTLKNYSKLLQMFHVFKLPKELQNIISCVIRDGMYVGYMYNSEKDGMFLMPLDVQYCRIYGKTPEGEWIVYMDASFFDKNDNKNYIYGINNDGIGVWDDCFIQGYEDYKNLGRDYQWFRLTPEKTMCIPSGTDDEFYMPLPYYFPLFKSLLRLLDTENLVASKEELQNYKLILNKIPLFTNTSEVDDFALSSELVEQFDAVLKSVVPDLVGVGTVPYDKTDVIDFEKSTSATDTDELNKAMNNLFANAGINRLIVSSGDSSNSNGIKYSNANDLGKIAVYLRRIESWLNYWIKKNISDGFSLQIFDETRFNQDDFIKEKKEAASLGGSKMDYLCALGDTPYIAYNKLRFESTALKIDQYMTPLQSTYTQSGGNSGGRPAETDETNLSPEGVSTRESGKNEDKGNK